MNKLMLVGRLTKNPELKGGENKVCLFTVAVNRKYVNANGEREADFIQIKTFNKLAENCSKFLKKGSRVSVEASIRTGSYQKDGKTIFKMEVIADEVGFLDPKGDSSNDNSNPYQDDRHQKDINPILSGIDYDPIEDSEWPF
ncbi:single-stranded DNA-binding protein [Neobacillus sp.]|jgi:single-strand DNA-binding protein|uniref:single-stranded DNA-binding protein n=1 Tax=Neobacillus sp. TaxID=2675273 RepID=UPI0035B53C2F